MFSFNIIVGKSSEVDVKPVFSWGSLEHTQTHV